MNTDNPMLSVVIISHNQREVLRRCIESVLHQETTFPVQVIVSDDRSADGTREMLLSEYKDRVIPTFFDSDKCNTTFTLERASYNRLNGLKYATGKYLVNIDGDDFYTSTDLFQTMVDTLEAHPECSMCCQNYCVVESSDVNATHIPACKSEILMREGIVPARDFFSQVLYLHASCFVARCGKVYNEENLQGIPYDDNNITARYIGDGDIAVLNRCDFVYVQYGQSTCATMSEDDKSIIFLPELLLAKLAPALAGVYMKRNLGAYSYVSELIVKRKPISKEIQAFYSRCDIFMLKNLGNNLSFAKRLRYRLILTWTTLMFALHLHRPFAYRVLYRLAVGKIDPDVKF